ncbi:MAG: hypothetical protein ACI8XO_005080 [Verrucomicrobiales bacterium]|jgi:hypothetical protein
MNTTTKASLVFTVILLVVSLIFAVQNMTELKTTREAMVDRDTEIARLSGLLTHEQEMNQRLVMRPQIQPQPVAQTTTSAIEKRFEALEAELDIKQELINAQEAEKEMLVERVEKQEIVREKELTDVQRRIRDAASIGEVSQVQEEFGFAVINAGKEDGIEPQMQFAIRRNVFIVGKVTVESVEGDESSIVNIVQGSVQPGLKIQPGDTVIAFPIY